MYTILYDGDTVHDPRSHDRYITEGTLSLEINTAGELSFTIPPTHPLFGRFEALNPRHELTVEEDGQEIFRGRILDHNRDIYTATSIKAEGQLAYLNDSVVRPYGTYADTPDEGQEPQWTTIAPDNRADYAMWLVEQHNENTDGTKRFRVQGLDLDASPITRSSTQFPNTANEILDKVLTPFGLILSAGYDGERTLEFRREPRVLDQTIEVGSNITEMESDEDYSELITCIVPDVKARSRDVDPPDWSAFPDGAIAGYYKQGDRFYSIEEAAKHGIIEESRSYEADTYSELVEQMASDLSGINKPVESFDISVIDLHQLNPGIAPIRLGEMYRVKSTVHGIDQYMTASSCEIDLVDPGNTKWTFGAVKNSLTRSNVIQTRSVEESLTSVIQGTDAIEATAQQAAEDAQQASADAQDAITAAAQKRRVFTSTPTPPYDIGDIWVTGDGEIKECIVAKEA